MMMIIFMYNIETKTVCCAEDIAVRFVEHNDDGSVKWEAHGNFSPLDVHRQVSCVYILFLLHFHVSSSSCGLASLFILSAFKAHSSAPKKNTSHVNEVLPQDTTHLVQRPCYQ